MLWRMDRVRFPRERKRLKQAQLSWKATSECPVENQVICKGKPRGRILCQAAELTGGDAGAKHWACPAEERQTRVA